MDLQAELKEGVDMAILVLVLDQVGMAMLDTQDRV
jgi:hypothetical protein